MHTNCEPASSANAGVFVCVCALTRQSMGTACGRIAPTMQHRCFSFELLWRNFNVCAEHRVCRMKQELYTQLDATNVQ